MVSLTTCTIVFNNKNLFNWFWLQFMSETFNCCRLRWWPSLGQRSSWPSLSCSKRSRVRGFRYGRATLRCCSWRMRNFTSAPRCCPMAWKYPLISRDTFHRGKRQCKQTPLWTPAPSLCHPIPSAVVLDFWWSVSPETPSRKLDFGFGAETSSNVVFSTETESCRGKEDSVLDNCDNAHLCVL